MTNRLRAAPSAHGPHARRRGFTASGHDSAGTSSPPRVSPAGRVGPGEAPADGDYTLPLQHRLHVADWPTRRTLFGSTIAFTALCLTAGDIERHNADEARFVVELARELG